MFLKAFCVIVTNCSCFSKLFHLEVVIAIIGTECEQAVALTLYWLKLGSHM